MRAISKHFWIAATLLAMLISAGCFQSASTGQPTIPPPAPATTAPQSVPPTSQPQGFALPTATVAVQQVFPTATPSPVPLQPMATAAPTSGVVLPPFATSTPAGASPPGWPTQPVGNLTPTPTFNPFAAATATIISATVTEAARLGTVYPTETPGPGTGTPMPTGTTTTSDSCTYVVRPGQNLFRIGLEVGVPYRQLAAANGIVNPDRIMAGQVLTIPGCTPSTGGETTTGQRTYVVRRGDNLFRIALNHGVTVQELAAANGITNPRLIYEGQVLIIPE